MQWEEALKLGVEELRVWRLVVQVVLWREWVLVA